ncbi:MAG: DUF1080 domain-containing protein [Clostridiaceae bacterium]|nr:DUF1080 domain-containing protein [Clostridiaceae bacterium]
MLNKKVASILMAAMMIFNLIIGMPAIDSFAQGISVKSSAEEELNTVGADAVNLYEVTDNMLLWYKFDETSGTTAMDSSGSGNDGILRGGASWSTGKILGSVKLNGVDGYVEMPNGILSNVEDFTIATWVKVNSQKNFQRIFDFGVDTNKNMFLTPNAAHSNATGLLFAITLESYTNEQRISAGYHLGMGEWKHIAVTISGNTGIIYENGVQVGKNENMTLKPSDLGNTLQNYIGRSVYSADPYFDGEVDDFRIYNTALGEAEIRKIMEESVVELTDEEVVAITKEGLTLGDTSAVTENLILPVEGYYGATISWSSSNPEIISPDGWVVRPEKGKGNAEVVLTATIRKGTAVDTKTFIVTVLEHSGVSYGLNINVGEPGIEISPYLYGIFYEDINHAADGGIYAELISNRSFEDNSGNPVNWYLVKGQNSIGSMFLDTTNLLNSAQQRALCLNIESVGQNERVGVANRGYWGMNIVDGARYELNFYARCSSDFNGPITVSLENTSGTEKYAQQTITGVTTDWKKFSCVLTANGSSKNAQLVISASDTGKIYLDVVSLFPETWKGRPNGLRIDLAEKVADLKPTFVRFPGGCFVEGDTLENAFRWKNTIGDISERPGHWNLWGYRTTDGLGYHEFLQWCEDLGAEPLFVVNCGMAHDRSVPLNEIQPWIQDALDAIEYANGPVTSTWGAKRAANGHPEPFNLKYIEIGNENNFRYNDYAERYPLFYNAIKEKYPDINIISNCDIPGQPIEYIDEHYYSSPEWFISNAYKYDSYDRKGPKIYVGEYAVTQNCGLGNLHAAIGEAAFMTGMERNSDIVVMSSYAPLFVNVNDRKWNPDAICFDSSGSYGTPSYYVQKMFSENVGDKVLPVTLTDYTNPEVSFINGAIGLGSWATQVEYDDVVLTKNTGEVLFSDDFSIGTDKWAVYKGNWQVQNGVYRQTSTDTDCRSTAGNTDWNNYTLTLKAKKNAGNEGFLIMFGVKDSNNYYWWNLGGWGNTRHAIEKAVGGSKSVIAEANSGKIETNRWYDIKIEVSGNRIRCYLDDELIHDVVDHSVSAEPLYYVASIEEETGDVILKVVNTSEESLRTQIKLDGVDYVNPQGMATVLTSKNLNDENTFSQPTKVAPVSRQITGVSTSFTYDFPRYSVTVLRLNTKKTPQDKEYDVDTTFNLSKLEGDKHLGASVTVRNNGNKEESVIAIVALYDGENKMVNVSFISKEIRAGQAENMKAGFKLPPDVSNHKVRVFVWDGTSLEDTTMQPLSNMVELQ